jgi:hypothetical protein
LELKRVYESLAALSQKQAADVSAAAD